VNTHLNKRILSTGRWQVLATTGQTVFRLGSNLIMTRLLMPEAFGMVALAATLMTAMILFTDIGIKQSIVREIDGADAYFLRVAWVAKIFRGLFIALCILIFAGALQIWGPLLMPVDSVYAQPEMSGLLVLVALVPVLQSLESTNFERVHRELSIGRVTMLELVAQVLSIVTMVAAAVLSPTVWSLMFGMLSRHIYFAIFTHKFLSGPTMKFEWDREISRRLWTFGRWIMGSSALTFFVRFADNLFLAALMNTVSFGLFSIARIWIYAGREMVNRLVINVCFPAISEVLRERPKELRQVFRKLQTGLDIVCVTGFLGAYFFGPMLVDRLYTDNFQEAGTYLQLMAGMLLLQRSNNHSQLILSQGNSRTVLFITVIQAIGICTFVPLFFMIWGVNGAILASILAPALSVPYVLYLTRHKLGIKQIAVDGAIFLASLIVVGCVFAKVA